ncbi:hypothetical protein ACJIZ3_014612 [Penstemon smallii]|uniref:F-box domain-containing protein n=1 Tax=Penstemon smallii TaxID=265156 RepID=A0ABD3RKU5_9LAMI
MASTINHQNLIEDIILEILLRLPVKALSRFKCVCKLWYTLIESPSFINRHLSHENNRERLLVRHCGPDDEYAYALYLDENLSEYEEPDHWQMLLKVGVLLGPLNGIFCSFGINRQMALLNPATRKFRPIPFRKRDTPPHLTTCEDIFGFGMDPVSGNYKLVSLRFFWNEETNVAHYPSLVSVYNSGNDSWRYFEDADLVNSSRSTNKSLCNTFLNGVYYWLTESNENVAILAFDMSKEAFREIGTPHCIKPKEGELALCGDSISLLSYDPDKTNKYVDIWVMKKEGCWNKSFTIGPFPDLRWPLGLWNKSELLLETESLFLSLYNVKTKKLRTLKSRKKENGFFIYLIFSYKESLVSLKGDRYRFEELDISSDAFKDYFKKSSTNI